MTDKQANRENLVSVAKFVFWAFVLVQVAAVLGWL